MKRKCAGATVLMATLLGVGALPVRGQQQTAAGRPPWHPRLDHVMLAVGDLDMAAERYDDVLGFTLGPSARLPNGIDNVLVGFGDTTYVELVTVYDPAKAPPGLAPFADDGGGGFSLALRVDSAEDAASYLQSRGFSITGPFGSTVTIAGEETPQELFRLVLFDQPVLPNDLFFIAYDEAVRAQVVAQMPPNERDFTRHANGAKGLRAVWVAVGDLEQASRQYEALGLPVEPAYALPAMGAHVRCVRVGDGCILLAVADDDAGPIASFIQEHGEGIAGITVTVADVARAQASLASDVQASTVSYDGFMGKSIRIPATQASGLFIEMVEQ